MDDPVFRFIMQTGPTPGDVFILTGTETIIGRESTNQIVINDVEISRRHARVVPQGSGYLFQDLGSTNGSFIGGKRLVGPHLLQPGEVVTLGQNISLLYDISQEPVQADPDATIAASSSAGYQPVAQTYVSSRQPTPGAQARTLPPAPPPIYAEDVSQQPVEAYPSMEEEPSRGIDMRWLAAGCGCLTIASCVALAGFFYWIDIGGVARWCQFFGFLFSACP